MRVRPAETETQPPSIFKPTRPSTLAGSIFHRSHIARRSYMRPRVDSHKPSTSALALRQGKISLPAPLLDRREDICNGLDARLGAEVASAVHTHAHRAGLQVALSDHEHRVDFLLFGALNFPVDLVG